MLTFAHDCYIRYAFVYNLRRVSNIFGLLEIALNVKQTQLLTLSLCIFLSLFVSLFYTIADSIRLQAPLPTFRAGNCLKSPGLEASVSSPFYWHSEYFVVPLSCLLASFAINSTTSLSNLLAPVQTLMGWYLRICCTRNSVRFQYHSKYNATEIFRQIHQNYNNTNKELTQTYIWLVVIILVI